MPFGALHADMNGDGRITLGDGAGWLLEAFFVPGDWILWAVQTYAPSLATFLELDNGDYGGALAGALSAATWFALFIALIWTCSAVRELDRALTDFFVRTYLETRRKLRIGATLLVYRLRRLLRRRAAAQPQIAVPEELEISEQELLALRLHLGLAPGYALAVSEVAGALDLGRSETRKLLDRLRQLQLLSSTLGGCEGESAYTLAPAGRSFLASLRS